MHLYGPLVLNHDWDRECVDRRIRETGTIHETARLADVLPHGTTVVTCTSPNHVARCMLHGPLVLNLDWYRECVDRRIRETGTVL